MPDSILVYVEINNLNLTILTLGSGKKAVNKIQVGKLNCYADALALLEKAKTDGYKDSFIVAYNGKKRIELDEAKSLTAAKCK